MLRFALLLALTCCFPAVAAAQQQRVDVSDTFDAVISLQRAGHQAYVNKQWGLAVQRYRQYLALSPETATHEEVTSRLRRAERLLRQRSHGSMIAMRYPHGFGGGYFEYLKDDWSFYLSLQGRNWIVGAEVDQVGERTAELLGERQEVVVDPEGGSWSGDRRYILESEEPVHEYFMGTFGITQKLVYPFWLSAGVTTGYHKRFQRVAVADRERGAAEWVEQEFQYRLDDQLSSFALGGEAGLTLVLGHLSAHGGLTYTFGEVGYYFGIGFAGAQ